MKRDYSTFGLLPQKTSKLVSLNKVIQPNCPTKAKISKTCESFKKIDQVIHDYLNSIRKRRVAHSHTVFK